MEIIKYFFEEPVQFDTMPRIPGINPTDLRKSAPLYRGYLAGSSPDRSTVGLTSLENHEAFVKPLIHVFGQDDWHRVGAEHRLAAVYPTAVRSVLSEPGDTILLVASGRPDEDAALEAASAERRYPSIALEQLLASASAVLFAEPAHDGVDWSLFSAVSLKDRMVAAFREHPAPRVRRFVLQLQHARSEERFHFERWTLDDLPHYVKEIK